MSWKGKSRTDAIRSRTVKYLPVIWALICASAAADERVALRTHSGRFLRAAEDGTVRADRLFPAQQETFLLLPLEDEHVALKAHDGRLLAAEGRHARTLRADSPRVEPDDRETFLWVPEGENRVALKARNYRDFVVFDGRGPKPSQPEQSSQPGPAETVEIYHAGQIPPVLRSTLAIAIRGLVTAELTDKQYDKTRTQKKVKYIELPAPTWRDPGRKKRHRVLSMTEEFHVQAKLDGTPVIRILEMPYLKGYRDGQPGLLMFVVRAEFPVRGRVRYRIPGTLSASTGFATNVELAMVGEVRMNRSDQELSFGPPDLLSLHVGMRRLRLSNDLLDAVHRQVRNLINHELGRQQDRIRQQANRSLEKALKSRQLSHPLVRYLAFL